MTRNKTRNVLVGAALTLPSLTALNAMAATYYEIQGTTGDWSNPNNWTTTSNSSTVAATAVPGSADTADIAPTTAGADETLTVTSPQSAATVDLAPNLGKTATLTIDATGGTASLAATLLETNSYSGQHDDGTSIINIQNGGTVTATNAEFGYSTSGTTQATAVNVGSGGGTLTATTNAFIGNYSGTNFYLTGSGTLNVTGTTYIAYGNYNTATGTAVGNAELQIDGPTAAANLTTVNICRNTNGGETGLLDFVQGTLSTTSTLGDGNSAGSSSSQPTVSSASAIFEVDGATAGSSIKLNTNDTGAANTDGFTTGLSVSPSRLNTGGSAETSTLKIGLDANGSTLIQVTGDIFLNNGILDVDSLAGFTGAGNVAGDPGWYRLASYTGDLYDSGNSTVDPGSAVTLTSDDGLNYSLVNDPGYLTIQVAAVPEPASAFVLTALAGATLLRRRRR